MVRTFGDFLKLLCCMYHAVLQQHSGGRRDKRGEVFETMIFICKVTRLQPLQARKKMLDENLSLGACCVDCHGNSLVLTLKHKCAEVCEIQCSHRRALKQFIQGSIPPSKREH